MIVLGEAPVLVEGSLAGIENMPDGSGRIVSFSNGRWSPDPTISVGDLMEGIIPSSASLKKLGSPGL